MSGRTAGSPVPPRCREPIRAGDLVAINHSGGKDSQTITIPPSRIVPRARPVAVHAPIGDAEWPGTVEHIEATLLDKGAHRALQRVRYAAWYANTVTVEADTLDEALEKAIEAANEDPAVFGAAL